MSADTVKREACYLLGNTLKGRFLKCGLGEGGRVWNVLWACWVIRSRVAETDCAKALLESAATKRCSDDFVGVKKL